MKGRFRKGKKAHKKIAHPMNARQAVLAYRYEVWKTNRQTLAVKIFTTALVKHQCRIQLAMIAAQPRPIGEPVQAFIALKAARVVQIVVDTAKAIVDIWNKPNLQTPCNK